MSYKSMLVHLDASESAYSRLELALRLAEQFDAHLSALFTLYRPESGSFYAMAGAAEYLAENEKLRVEREEALRHTFQAELARTRLKGEWRATANDANQAVPEAARLADLIVAGQSDPGDPESFVATQFVENLVLSAGRPVLLVPCAGQFPSVGSRALLAWDASREATRAVHDAMPLLAQAKHVTILTVNALADEPPASRIPGTDIAAVVARHGVNVATEEVAGVRDLPIGDALLSHASDLGVDLIVMGCYGHSRWRELVLGGATRSILKTMTVPVLMSH